MTLIYKCIVFIILILLCALSALSQNVSMTIPLNKTATLWNKELYGDFVKLNHSSTLQVNFNTVNKNISFIVFQVHSHLYNVTLYNNTFIKGSYVSGTNVGLYTSAKKLDVFYIYNPSEAVDLDLFISVHGYGMADPIPGGCNMELPIVTAPFLITSYNKDYILVDGASPQSPNDATCNSVKDVKVTFYRMYLPERDFGPDAYFMGVKSMLTYESILETGEEIPETGVMWSMRRMLSAYPGTGSIYVAVAYGSTGYSVYVPASTYGCDLLDEQDGCVLLDDVLSQLICAGLLFVGAFVCYLGHRFFKTEMFLIGLVSGALVTYILLAMIADLDRPAIVGASIISGVFFGAIWLVFWFFYGIPIFAVLLSTLNLGFLVAAVVYYGIPEYYILEEDFNFWTVFIFIMTLTSAILISVTFLSNILCCCILGAYAIIYPIDYYIGTNLKYIIINTLRRAVVPKFNRAVVSPPFQLNDAILAVLWIGLALTGFLFQHFHNRGRPPFPPPPRIINIRMPAEGYGSVDTRYRQSQNIISPDSVITTGHDERTPLLA